MAYADLLIDGDTQRIIVQTTWQERELIKSVPGATWNRPINGVWNLPLGWGSYVVLHGVFGINQGIKLSERLSTWVTNYFTEVITPALESRSATELQHDHAVDTDDRLYPFQQVGAAFLSLTRRCLLGDDMGSGKTVQALTALSRQQNPFPAIVICPNAVKLHWAREAEIWCPDAKPYVVDGGAATKRKIIDAASTDLQSLLIINFESMRMYSRLAPYGSIRLRKCIECDPNHGNSTLKVTQCEHHAKELNCIPFKTVIIDEAHRIKDPRSKQTRATWAVAHGNDVEFVWGMTGTPIANNPLDLWSVMHAITPVDYATRTKFIDRYCLMGWNAFGVQNVIGIQPEHRKEFFSILDPRFRAMPKSLVLPQLPRITTVIRQVEMVPKQARAYREIRDLSQAMLDDHELLSTSNRLTRRIRLLQLASSYCTVERPDVLDPDNPWGTGWTVTPCEPSSKIDELLVCLEELGPKPVVIAAEHRQLIDLVAARFDKEKISYGLITGAIPQFERDRYLQQFQSNQLRTLLITVRAGGTGLTMTAADTIIFIQRPDSMVDYVQTMNRVHRIGSEKHKSILVVHIIVPNTVEGPQMERLQAKIDRLEEIKRTRDTILRAGGDISYLDAEEQVIMNSNLQEL